MPHRKYYSVTMWPMIYFLVSRHRAIYASSRSASLLHNDKRRIVTAVAFVPSSSFPSLPTIAHWETRRRSLCNIDRLYDNTIFVRCASSDDVSRQCHVPSNLPTSITNRRFATSKSTKLNCSNDTVGQVLELEAQTIEDMEDVGAVLGIGSQKGDVILLDGDLGAGKTCFSRGFVRAKTGYMDLRVTSPTYLLSNTYPVDNDDDNVLIHHMDLYRLSEGKEENLSPLNLDYVMKECISLIEWPSRLGSMIPNERLEITISIDRDAVNSSDEQEENTRILLLKPYGERWVQRLQRVQDDGYLDDLIVEYEEDGDDQN